MALFDPGRMTDRTAADDLVQDIFVRILKYRATYRDGGSFETWVFRIARNARADYFRTRRPLEPLAAEALERPEPGPGPMRRLEADREQAQLKHALLRLREDKRELIVLARYRGMKHEQIAALLGIETGAVKVRIHRAPGSQDILAASFTSQIEQPGGEVTLALLDTLMHDPNVNVRLATIDALKRFAGGENVRRGVLEALARQTSPLVQIALIDYVVETNDRGAADALRRLSSDPMLDQAVRGRATQALQQIG